MGLICVWAMVSAVWAPDTWLAVRGALKLSGNLLAGGIVFAFALGVGAGQERPVRYALAAGFGLAFGLLLVEVFFAAPISASLWAPLPAVRWYGYFWLNGCASVLSLLAWPLALVLWRRYTVLAGAALVAAMLVIDVLLGAETAALALLAGGAAAFATWAAQRGTATVLAAALVVSFLLAPLLPGTVLKPEILEGAPAALRSALVHRLYIWRFAAERIAEHPLRGWGMNASRTVPGGKDHAIDPGRGDVGENLPLHPHNMMLQVWLELGLPGALMFAALGAVVIVRLAGAGVARRVAAIRIGHAGTVLVIYSSSFSTWSSWWLAALWLAASMTAILSAPPRPEMPGSGPVPGTPP